MCMTNKQVTINLMNYCTVLQGRPFTTSEKLLKTALFYYDNLHSISHQPIRSEETDTVEMILGILSHRVPDRTGFLAGKGIDKPVVPWLKLPQGLMAAPQYWDMTYAMVNGQDPI